MKREYLHFYIADLIILAMLLLEFGGTVYSIAAFGASIDFHLAFLFAAVGLFNNYTRFVTVIVFLVNLFCICQKYILYRSRICLYKSTNAAILNVLFLVLTLFTGHVWLTVISSV